MDPKDFVGKFLRDDLTKEELDKQIQQSERTTEWDHVIKDGKIYLSADELIKAMENSAKFSKLLCAIKGDPRGIVMSEGIEVCAEVVRGANSELLRREAHRISGI